MRRAQVITLLLVCGIFGYACIGPRAPLKMRAVPTEQFPVSWYGEEHPQVSTTTTATTTPPR